jgi:hypothetical protein
VTAEQSAAFINAASSRAVIRAMAMQAENHKRVTLGHALAYGEDQILGVIDEEGIGHNTVVTLINESR